MKKLKEVKQLVNNGFKKTMEGLLQGLWNVYKKIYDKLYDVKCMNTSYIPDLSVNIFILTCAMIKD